jgi:hypothetical protein
MGWQDRISQSGEENITGGGASHPWFQWVNGKSALKAAGNIAYTGGFFVPREQIDAGKYGWSPFTNTVGGNTEVDGFQQRDLTLCVIAIRRWWVVKVGDKSVNYKGGGPDSYDIAQRAGGGKNPTGKVNVLCIVRGMEEVKPVVFTAAGYVGMAFAGGKAGTESVMSLFTDRILRRWKALRGDKELPATRCFWITVGPQRNPAGAPNFIMVGKQGAQSPVTLPTLLNTPEESTLEQIEKRYIGDTLFDESWKIFLDNLGWLREHEENEAKLAKIDALAKKFGIVVTKPTPSEEESAPPPDEVEDIPF